MIVVIEERCGGEWVELSRHASEDYDHAIEMANELIEELEEVYPSPEEPDCEGVYPESRYSFSVLESA